MQGRITKVLNMKPPETLSMIEEAAGTRMFEDKKESAISTITKKEKKLEEIQSVIFLFLFPLKIEFNFNIISDFLKSFYVKKLLQN